ncbi:MAG: hypothetical protein IT383_08485 [Deltaproteobacteria bacterium]|nr:hypothetical protein [Deltaproteobacteria bacterium]
MIASAPRVLALPLALALTLGASACLTTVNKPKLIASASAPAVDKRADGCHVDVYQDGEEVQRPHAVIGTVALDWPQKKIEEQGPEGAIATLKAFACENGAFLIKDLRALAMGVGEGMIYEGTFATLLDDKGKPINAKGVPPGGDAGPPTEAVPPASGG